MRPWLFLPVVVLCAFPPGAAGQNLTGGASPPVATGGAEYGTKTAVKRPAPRRRARAALRASHFAMEPRELVPGGAPATISYRIDGAARRVRVRVELLRRGAKTATERIRLGWKPTGVRRVNRWTVPAGLPAGSYVARLHAVTDDGRVLVRPKSAPGRIRVHVVAPPPPVPGPFPIQGDWSWGGDGSQFGADRGSHRHQGQDLIAAEGTPVVAPRPGHVRWKDFQAGGAGHYVVIRGDDGRDYVFMHLVAGSIPVSKGDAVAQGQVIGAVGDTGRSDGAHLHFEIWPCGWYEKDCAPVDPRPDLEAWARAS